jgi:PAS domain S-box-containing protein
VEDRFRQLLEAAPDAIVITDQRGVIVLVNEQTERLFGYAREELLGESVELLVPERLRQRHREHREAYVASPSVRPMAGRPELCAVRKDGSEFPAEITLSPLETEEGVFITSAIRDITERKRTEQIIRNNEAQLLAAQRIQERLLPHTAPRLRGLDIAGGLHPAEFAAGDFFDYIGMPDGTLGVTIGDVSGHGFGAALWMATLRGHLRSLAKTGADVETIVTTANALLLEEAEQERFATLLLARLDPRSHRLVYANAGHPAGHVIDEAGNVTHELESTGLPLAVFSEAEFPLGRAVTLKPGDLVLMVTDGVLEAESPHGAMFGWRRAVEVAQENRHRSARQIVEALHNAVRDFSGRPKPADDVTAVVIKVLCGA